ncbi:hypothetical protein MMC09_003121 [Bachmanniomyces sp. S44760]|nr:hypothetical protein [Bachmanniomyces sp. S44760]
MAQPTRFELELEFIQLLSSPLYLSHLASTTKLLTSSAPFIAYLSYLHATWTQPAYVRYLRYPRSTLRVLELLQQEGFRRDVLRPEVVEGLAGGLRG